MNEKIRTFGKGEVIFREGVYERCMYDIVSGSVDICVNYDTDDEKHLVMLEAGQFFGEIGITEMMPRTATAIAASDDTRLAEITVENFGAYYREAPDKLLSIMRHMSARLRALTADYIEAKETIREAAGAARDGEKQTEGLAQKLAKLVRNAVKPSFLSGKPFDEAAFMAGQADGECAVRTFRKNEIIFREGDEANCMYDILYGDIGIYTDHGKPGQQCLAQLRDGEYFGEMGLIDNMPRSATAVSLTEDTRLRLVSGESFGRYLSENPAKVMSVMMHLSSRIRAMTKAYMKACAMAEEAEKAAVAKQIEDYWRRVLEDCPWENDFDPEQRMR